MMKFHDSLVKHAQAAFGYPVSQGVLHKMCVLRAISLHTHLRCLFMSSESRLRVWKAVGQDMPVLKLLYFPRAVFRWVLPDRPQSLTQTSILYEFQDFCCAVSPCLNP